MRFDRSLLAAFFAILIVAAAAQAQSVVPDVPLLDLENHPPIVIDGDGDFLSPENGVRSGSGTSSDPYVINNWLIDPMWWRVGGTTAFLCDNPGMPQFCQNAITIKNTTQAVHIRANQIVNAGIGILLQNVSGDVRISELVTGNMSAVISVTDFGVTHNSVVGGTLTIDGNGQLNGGGPVAVNRGTGDIVIFGNVMSGTGTRAISITAFNGTVEIRNNTIGGSPEHAAIYLANANASTVVESNNITCPGAGAISPPPAELRSGVYAFGTGSIANPLVIEDNLLKNCRNAVRLDASVALIQGNCFDLNMNGVVLESLGAESSTINFNDFRDNQGLAVLNEIPGTPTVDATSNFWNRPSGLPGPNQFGTGPERTYPHDGSIDVSGATNVRQAPFCGR